jgi:phosphoribosylanthranilate isomerase
MTVKVKICGLTQLEDAAAAIRDGADYLGFIFYAPSPRSIPPAQAAPIITALKAQFDAKLPLLIGVFVNEAPASIAETLRQLGLDAAQLSGEESPADLLVVRRLGFPAYKALRPPSLAAAQAQISQYPAADPPYPAILVDSYHPTLRGGTGEQADPTLVAHIRALTPRMMLAGGLTADNVADQVRRYQPFAVDVASGVEAEKGKKDHQKMQRFIQAAKS